MLRGMWGKRAAEQAMSYVLCATQPAVHMFFCKKYPDANDEDTEDLLLPEKKNYNAMLKGMWG